MNLFTGMNARRALVILVGFGFCNVIARSRADETVSVVEARYAAVEQEAVAIAEKLRQAKGESSPAKIAELESKLVTAVRNALSQQIQMQAAQLNEAQAEIDERRKQLGQRQKLADRIVARRVAELLMDEQTAWEPKSQPLKLPQTETALGLAPNSSTSSKRQDAADTVLLLLLT
jgi:hypothetical protein